MRGLCGPGLSHQQTDKEGSAERNDRTEDQCIYRMRQRLQELVDLVERKGDCRQ